MFVILLSILIIEIRTNIIIPFKLKEYPVNKNETSEKIFLNNFLYNLFTGILEIGTPSQIIEAQISGKNYGIQLKEGICYSSQYYNKKYSSSLIEKNHCENTNIYSLYKEININETILFKTNEKKTIKIKDFSLLYFKEFSDKEKELVNKFGRKIQLYEDLYELFDSKYTSLEINKDGKACLLIGMKLSSSYNCLPNSNFIQILKDNNIIKEANWAIKFNNDNKKNEFDGEFIIGSSLHENFPNEYNKEQLSISNVLNYKYYQDWELQFKTIYFFKKESEINQKLNDININDENIIIVDNNINIEFDIDTKIIFGTKNYYNNIYQNYFMKYKDKCNYEIMGEKYGIFICDKNFNVNNFPTLYFYNHIYNYTFEMNFTNLFLDKNDKKYFLIVFDDTKTNVWTFGTLFLKQYAFIFNTNEKTIGFYNKDIIINKTGIMFWITNLIYIILIIITGIGGFFLGKKIYNKVRNKKIYELNDDFVYKTADESKIAMEMASK